ncbi:hypothetical protein TNCV_1521491 [Trichonephila clavipes]|nr:hypothetical protein TNCV_1521491 [Trichonephila clavipes]
MHPESFPFGRQIAKDYSQHGHQASIFGRPNDISSMPNRLRRIFVYLLITGDSGTFLAWKHMKKQINRATLLSCLSFGETKPDFNAFYESVFSDRRQEEEPMDWEGTPFFPEVSATFVPSRPPRKMMSLISVRVSEPSSLSANRLPKMRTLVPKWRLLGLVRERLRQDLNHAFSFVSRGILGVKWKSKVAKAIKFHKGTINGVAWVFAAWVRSEICHLFI